MCYTLVLRHQPFFGFFFASSVYNLVCSAFFMCAAKVLVIVPATDMKASSIQFYLILFCFVHTSFVPVQYQKV